MPDVAIPIVFPDYLIRVDTPPVRVDVPDWLPGVPNQVTVPGTSARVPYLGHAGILFFNGRSGLTKYYEYGRYDPAARGLVRNQRIPDVRIDRQSGLPTRLTLAATLARISTLSGQRGRILGAYIDLPLGAFVGMLAHAQTAQRENTNPRRAPYELTSHSCLHFAKEVAEAGGAAMPGVLDPRPAGYIERVRDNFPDLDFRPAAALTVEGITFP